MNVNLIHSSLTGCILVGTIAPQGAIATPLTLQSAPFFLTETPLQMAQTDLLTGNWKLANMTAGDLPTPMLPTTEQTANFAAGRISGSGGCNRFTGSYETEGDRLQISPLASTFMACPPEVMNQELTYLAALQGAQQYELTPEGLTIAYRTEAGAGVLRFITQTNSESMNEQNTEPANASSQPVRGLW